MGTAERRTQIMLIMCRRRHDTVLNLAKELGVSTRTILRDIEVLSITEPIYTQCGRYGGGIYVTAEYTMTRMYMTEKELAVLHKLSKLADEKAICELSTDESVLLKSIISQYTKQKS